MKKKRDKELGQKIITIYFKNNNYAKTQNYEI